MSEPPTPYIVRPAPPAYFAKPGLHSHNAKRRKGLKRAFGALHGVRLMLLLFGIVALGYYAYTLCDQYVYEAYQNWAFDQEIAGRAQVNFADYIRERTPFGFLVGKAPTAVVPKTDVASRPAPRQPARPAEGVILGRVEIGRLNLAAVVREGVDADVLKVAVGHVPSTALPGQPGNFAIAAHRDTLFRGLKDIQRGDLVSFESPSATYTYKVVATKIVRPTDVSVLQPDGGGLIPPTQVVSNDGQPNTLLTMITCYPFYYVGSAPKRFIVEAELVGNTGKQAQPNQLGEVSPPPGDVDPVSPRMAHRKLALQTEPQRRRLARGSSHSGNLHHASTAQESRIQTPHKRRFWHRLFHVS